jgi:hypothetical protein
MCSLSFLLFKIPKVRKEVAILVGYSFFHCIIKIALAAFISFVLNFFCNVFAFEPFLPEGITR